MAQPTWPERRAEPMADLTHSFVEALADADPLRLQWIDVLTMHASLKQLRKAIEQGDLSATELTLFYLSRIQRYDNDLNSIIELNPHALNVAGQRDAARARGDSTGALHGLPVLLKDNIATGDGLHNTAGAIALAQHRPSRDAFLVQRLRAAGAVILGKTNLSEWSYFMSDSAPSGYSAMGGQAKNPFGSHLDVSGSSSGSAIAVAARFCALAIGTETNGSIIAPSAANGVAGMCPSMGMVSSDLIIPITAALDRAGPIARSVSDLATVLTIISAPDARTPTTGMVAGLRGSDFEAALGSVSLRGLRIGVPAETSASAAARKLFWRMTNSLEDQGSVIVPIDWSNGSNARLLAGHQITLFAGSMSDDVAAYLKAADAPVTSIAEVIDFNNERLIERARYGQSLLERTQTESMCAASHRALADQMRAVAAGLITNAASANRLDVIVTLDNQVTTVYALAGFPAITIPIGLDENGQPHGATFIGIANGVDAQLLAITFEFESRTRLRVDPQ